MKRAGDILCSAIHRVSTSKYESDPERADHFANKYLREIISDVIIRDRAMESRDDFYKEYRLELYVATPREFWEIVEREAQEIAFRFKGE